jgi:hypothetical protein
MEQGATYWTEDRDDLGSNTRAADYFNARARHLALGALVDSK